MSTRFMLLVATIAAFTLLTAEALLDVGYFGIFKPHFQSWGGAQVFVDLVIVAMLACIWMVEDARGRGLNAWPFVFLTLLAGSFGPLLYLALRELRASGGRPASA
jgi:hypothetical protein